jgi:predicted SprT family Zn-dependent metalloprotease
MAHFSDQYHYDKCTMCKGFFFRTHLARQEGKRSYFCERCWGKRLLGKWPKPNNDKEV